MECAVAWQNDEIQNIWERYRKAGKPVIVLEVGGLLRNISFKIGINGINRDADFANQDSRRASAGICYATHH